MKFVHGYKQDSFFNSKFKRKRGRILLFNFLKLPFFSRIFRFNSLKFIFYFLAKNFQLFVIRILLLEKSNNIVLFTYFQRSLSLFNLHFTGYVSILSLIRLDLDFYRGRLSSKTLNDPNNKSLIFELISDESCKDDGFVVYFGDVNNNNTDTGGLFRF